MIVSIKQLKAAFNNFAPAMIRAQEIAVKIYAKDRIPKHFTNSGQKDANYKPLTPAYAKAKLARYGAKPILVASGKLKNKVTSGYRVIRRGRNVFLDIKYPRYGSIQRRSGRDFLKLTQRDKRFVIHMLRKKFISLRRHPFSIR